MTLDRDWIESRIPHRGRMCLLDRVIDWDADHVRCAATSHCDPQNPLRAHGRLGAACGIEYAAQAMAVHGALMAGGELSMSTGAATSPRPHGMLMSVRNVSIDAARLDDLAGSLTIVAQRQSGASDAIGYTFEISSEDKKLLSGRATVMLRAPQS